MWCPLSPALSEALDNPLPLLPAPPTWLFCDCVVAELQALFGMRVLDSGNLSNPLPSAPCRRSREVLTLSSLTVMLWSLGPQAVGDIRQSFYNSALVEPEVSHMLGRCPMSELLTHHTTKQPPCQAACFA